MRIRLALVFSVACSTSVAHAADVPASGTSATPRMGIEEVVVTAERRESSLQETPIAISVFNGEFMEDSNITNVQDLGPYAPGLNYTQVSNFAQLNIRGIGLEQINLGGEPGVAFHQDGVYLARPYVNNAVFVDLERVEVVRGPQGTLYGRNATGGSLNLIPKRPTDEFEGNVSTILGDYDRVRLTTTLSGPLTSSGGIRGRLSLVTDKHDGYLENQVDGQDLEDNDTKSGRAEVDFDLTDSLDLALSADYMREDDTGPVMRVGDIGGTAPGLGGQVGDAPWEIFINGPHDQNVRDWGTSARLNWDLGSVSVMSLTAYRDTKFRLQSDLDGTDFFLVNEDLQEDAEQVSEEIQVSSNGDGRLTWIAGAYYFHEDGNLDYQFPIPLFATTIRFVAKQDTNAYALFGEVTYAVTDKLSLTAGARYSEESKRGSTQQTFFVISDVSVDDSWSATTPRFVADYQISDSMFGYLSIAKGFKSGGINTGGTSQQSAYDPEYIWNYELGLKSTLLDGRLQTNLATFYYTYDDLQVNQFAVGRTFIENAASAEGYGIEAEVTALVTDGLSLDVALAYLDAEFTKYDSLDSFRPTLGILNLDGNELPRAPNFKASVVARYEIPIGSNMLTLQGEYQHQDDEYFTPFNTNFAQGGGFDLVNARVAFAPQDARWEVALYGRNLTDDEYELTETVSGINAGTLELFGPPRTYGLEGRYKF